MDFHTFGPLSPARRRFDAEGEVFAAVAPGCAVRIFGEMTLGSLHWRRAVEKVEKEYSGYDMGAMARAVLEDGSMGMFGIMLDFIEENQGYFPEAVWLLDYRDGSTYKRERKEFDRTFFVGDTISVPGWYRMRDPRLSAIERARRDAMIVKVCWKSCKVRVARDADTLSREYRIAWYEFAAHNWRAPCATSS